MPVKISVIIPVLNEEAHIAEVIAATRDAGQCELIVVDGGSTDATVAHAADADQVLFAPRGRAVQMNTGARQASGDVLLFLHADCRLPRSFDDAIEEALNRPMAVGGCFRQRIQNVRKIYRIIEWGNAQRVHRLGWIYGDQAMFVRRSIFEQLGGFPEIPFLEDLRFSQRLRRQGRLDVIPVPLLVDSRRWERLGICQTTLRNWSFLVLAQLGVPLETLGRWYGAVRTTVQ